MKLQFYRGPATTIDNAIRIEAFYTDASGLHFVDQTIADIYQTQLQTHFHHVGLKSDKAFSLTDTDGNIIIAVKDNPKSRFTESFINQVLEIAVKYQKNIVMPIFRTGNVSQQSEAKITERMITTIERFIDQHPTLTQTINIVLKLGENYTASHILEQHNISTLGVANTKGAFIRLLL